MNLKNCPFCGLEARMHYALFMSEYADVEDNIPKDARIIREFRRPGEKRWKVEFRRRAYVPQCSDPTCPGRLNKQFKSEKEAVEAWNRRADNGSIY